MRHSFFNRRCADDPGIAYLDERRAFSRGDESGSDSDRTELIYGAIVRTEYIGCDSK